MNNNDILRNHFRVYFLNIKFRILKIKGVTSHRTRRNSLVLRRTIHIVAIRSIPCFAEFLSHPEGICKVGVRRSLTRELFLARELRRVTVSVALYRTLSSDIPSMESRPDERGGREKLKSHQ